MRWTAFALLAGLAIGVSAPAAGGADEPSRGVTVDKAKRAVIIDAKVAPRKLEHLKGEIYPIEVIACWAHPKGKKAHETVVTIEAKPSDVAKALESIGLKPGQPARGEGQAKGPPVQIFIEVPGEGAPKRLALDRVLVDPKSGKPFPKSVQFRFTGSVMSKIDPEKPETAYGADLTGTLIAIFPVTDETVCQSSLTMKEEKYLTLETNKANLPKEGTPVKLILQAGGK